jgi:hypothetical protein
MLGRQVSKRIGRRCVEVQICAEKRRWFSHHPAELLTRKESGSHVSCRRRQEVLLETHDTSQRDCPWRDVIAPEIEHSRQSCDLEGDEESLVDEDWRQRSAATSPNET